MVGTLNKTESKVYLPPFQIQDVSTSANEIPYGIEMINAPDLWDETKGESVVIAIIDTGIDKTHPDLQGSVIGGYNFTTNNVDDYQDGNGHGTHVAGTIAGIQNGFGVVGVAPKCKLLILKALDDDGSGYIEWITNAIQYAVNWTGKDGEKVQAISMSLGGPPNEEEHAAIKQAIEKGILIICAAGNEGDDNFETDELGYPAAYPEVISVGAVDSNKKPAYFTNTNEEVDLVAPGVDIKSTYLKGQYALLSGTSMATPHVSGAVALLSNKLSKEFGRKLTEPELYAQLVKHTTTLDLDRRVQGNGILDLLAVPTPEPDPVIPKKTKEVLLSINNIDAPLKVRKRKNSIQITWEE
ncbi:S8 family peptidase [Peribacillus frigoritolerans]|uniref:S8 family peptidase n=1 Tax=Peribacillus frigoritolerans TaxID=450367 RepID=UPI00292F2D02|nr:S8 family peptidase [Peribacillus frigoritolerans]